MKYFPIKIAVACLLIPPVLYVLTLSLAESYLNQSYKGQLQNIMIGDSKTLLNGSIRIEEQIAENIDTFLTRDWKIQKTGLEIEIRVTTSSGKIIYPVFLDTQPVEKNWESSFNADILAKNNYNVLHSGLDISVNVNINHGSFWGNFVLIFYFGTSLLIFFQFYKSASAKSARDRQRKAQEISELKKEEASFKKILNDLKKERQGLFENIKALNQKYEKVREKAKINEDEMFEEIITLEGKLKSFIDLKKQKETEISELKNQVQRFERRKSSKTRRNEFEFQDKRFAALYKDVIIERKALTGFLNLNEDQQIKAEEIIHQLDRHPEKIVIKRKVFTGKKHRTACFEVLFAYNGRLYFTKDKNNKSCVLVIGTKNSQGKDMEYLHSI